MKKQYKIAVFTSLKDDLNATLKTAAKVAQIINANIEVFNIQTPTEIIKKENQLSAIRTINSERISSDKKMQGLIAPFAKELDLKINYSFAFGNMKSKISNFIDKQMPDIIILGKQKKNPLKLFGDGVTKFVLKSFKGIIMMVPNKLPLEPNAELNLGALDNMEPWHSVAFTEYLFQQTKAPLKSFRFIKNADELGESHIPKTERIIEYVFEQNDNSVDKLPEYLKKSNINLLLVNRTKKNGLISSDFYTLINKIPVPIMVMGEKI